jgi:hypothetical protein
MNWNGYGGKGSRAPFHVLFRQFPGEKEETAKVPNQDIRSPNRGLSAGLPEGEVEVLHA